MLLFQKRHYALESYLVCTPLPPLAPLQHCCLASYSLLWICLCDCPSLERALHTNLYWTSFQWFQIIFPIFCNNFKIQLYFRKHWKSPSLSRYARICNDSLYRHPKHWPEWIYQLLILTVNYLISVPKHSFSATF